jgi:hypothetical protein
MGLYHGYRGSENGYYPNNNEAGPAMVGSGEIDSGLVVRNIEALDTGGSGFQGSGADVSDVEEDSHEDRRDVERGEFHDVNL